MQGENDMNLVTTRLKNRSKVCFTGNEASSLTRLIGVLDERSSNLSRIIKGLNANSYCSSKGIHSTVASCYRVRV